MGAFDGWEGGASLDAAARELGMDAAASHRSVELVRALLVAHPGSLASLGEGEPSGSDVAALLMPSAVRAATGWHEWQSEAYVVQEAWEEWLDALAARDALDGGSGTFAAADRLRLVLAVSGFRVTPSPSRVDAAAEPTLDAAATDAGAQPTFDADAEREADADLATDADLAAEPDAEV